MDRWLGIDFSGNHLKWRSGCTTSNVWVADVRLDDGGLFLHDVRRVQQLPGAELPFERLAALFASGEFEAAGIDAPFSVPDDFVRRVGGHAALLKLVGAGPVVGRPFLSGPDMVRLISGMPLPLVPPKPMRGTDTAWSVTTRSPMRPGAPMTAACLTLLHRTGRAMWPWDGAQPGLLAEAFPAAQLNRWGLPHQSYDGRSTEATAARRAIIGGLPIQLGRWTPTLLGSADALDSVICAFAAVAVSSGTAVAPRGATVATEGWMAVHP